MRFPRARLQRELKLCPSIRAKIIVPVPVVSLVDRSIACTVPSNNAEAIRFARHLFNLKERSGFLERHGSEGVLINSVRGLVYGTRPRTSVISAGWLMK